MYLSAFGTPVIILGSHEAAVDLLDKRSTIYFDRNLYAMSELYAGCEDVEVGEALIISLAGLLLNGSSQSSATVRGGARSVVRSIVVWGPPRSSRTAISNMKKSSAISSVFSRIPKTFMSSVDGDIPRPSVL